MFKVWILGILDFGDFGFWILDFGDFGWAPCDKILDATQEKKTVHAEPGRRISAAESDP